LPVSKDTSKALNGEKKTENAKLKSTTASRNVGARKSASTAVVKDKNLICDIGSYTLQDLHEMYGCYKHKRIRHVLL
jgi:hypothetical protein